MLSFSIEGMITWNPTSSVGPHGPNRKQINDKSEMPKHYINICAEENHVNKSNKYSGNYIEVVKCRKYAD